MATPLKVLIEYSRCVASQMVLQSLTFLKLARLRTFRERRFVEGGPAYPGRPGRRDSLDSRPLVHQRFCCLVVKRPNADVTPKRVCTDWPAPALPTPRCQQPPHPLHAQSPLKRIQVKTEALCRPLASADDSGRRPASPAVLARWSPRCADLPRIGPSSRHPRPRSPPTGLLGRSR